MTGRPRNAAPSEGFQGFGSGMMGFFAELAEHQTRDWFTANRPRFDREIRLPMEQLVTSATLALAARDIPLMGIPKTSIFRINRDIRFSKNKIPYKTNASAVLTRTGTKHSQGVLYIHVGLDGAFLALGFYGPEPEALAALRDAIADAPERFQAVTTQLAHAGLALSRDQIAARLPRGYDAAALGDSADWIRLKSLVVTRDLSLAQVSSPRLVTAIAEFATAGMPLLQFGWRALTEVAPGTLA